jgi:hypothetical protein
MSFIKKSWFFNLLTTFILLLVLSPLQSFAQIVPADSSQLQVEIKNVAYSDQKRLVTIDFAATNTSKTFADNLNYAFEFHNGEKLATSGLLFAPLKQIFSISGEFERLAPGQTVRKTVQYEVPRTIPGGSYFIKGAVFDNEITAYGMTHTTEPLRMTGVGGYITNKTGVLLDKSTGTEYRSMEGPTLEKDGQHSIVFSKEDNEDIFSYLETDEIYSDIKISHLNESKEIVFEKSKISLNSLINDDGDVEFKIEPWQNIKSGPHAFLMSFKDSDGNKISEDFNARILYKGLIGKIYNVDTNINSYRRGERINVGVSSVIAGDSTAKKAFVKIILKNKGEVVQEAQKEISLNSDIEGTNSTALFNDEKISKSTLIDEVKVILTSEDGTVLDEQVVTMDTSKVFAYPKESNVIRNILIGLAVLILGLVIWAFVKKKFNLNIVSVVIALVFISGALISSNPDSVFAQYGNSNEGYIYGCMDIIANNFNPSANIDDGSCEYGMPYFYGCTDSSALNYDAAATMDDGSCIAKIPGCTDFTATNWNSNANWDDGTCNYNMFGCTDPAANNHNAGASIDDGSCRYDGCTDPSATNYDPQATDDDQSCTYGGVVLNNMDLIDIWSVPEGEPSGDQGICDPTPIPTVFYVKIQCEACGNAALDVDVNYFNNWKGDSASSPSSYNSSTVVNTSDIGNGHVFYEFVFGPFYYDFQLENFNQDGTINESLHDSATGKYIQNYALQVITQFGGNFCKVTKNEEGEIYEGMGVEEDPREISCSLPAEIRSAFFIDYDQNGIQGTDEPYIKSEEAIDSCLGDVGAPFGLVEGYASSSQEMLSFAGLLSSGCDEDNAPYFLKDELQPGTYRAGIDLSNAFGWLQTGVQYFVNGSWMSPESISSFINLESNVTLKSRIGLSLDGGGYPVSVSCKATPEYTRSFPVDVTWSLNHYFSDEYDREDLELVWNGVGSLPDNAVRSGGVSGGSYSITYDESTGGSKDYSIQVYARNSSGEQVSNTATCSVQIEEMTASCYAYPSIQAIDSGAIKQRFNVNEDVYWSADIENAVGSVSYQWYGAYLGDASGNQNKTVGPANYPDKRTQYTARVEATDSEGMSAEASCSIFIRECVSDDECPNGLACDSVEEICVYPPPEFTQELFLDPGVVNTGEQCNLKWTVDEADSCILYKNGNVYDSNAATTTPGVSVDPGTYTILCENEVGVSVTGGPVRCLVNPNIREQ